MSELTERTIRTRKEIKEPCNCICHKQPGTRHIVNCCIGGFKTKFIYVDESVIENENDNDKE